MSKSRTIRKIGFVAFSNFVKLVSSVLIAFLLPNILGVTNYGYYKVFILYMTYLGLFHFGFIDGIYLKFGGKDYHELNREKFRTYFRFLLNLEVIIALIGIVASLLFIKDEKRFIFLLLSFNLLAINLTTYYQFISQITSRFAEYSARIIILSVTNIFIVAYMLLSRTSDYRIFILLIVLINYFLLFWYIYTYREITFGKKGKVLESKDEIQSFFKNGIPLLLSNLASTLVITVDRQIVEILFPVETFSVYSFAYSMLAIITVVVAAVGVVLYPTFKKSDVAKLTQNYDILNRVIILVVLIGLIAYFPLLWIIPTFLPDYIASLPIFRIAMPGLIMTSSIAAIKHNYYKVTNKNMKFFIIGLISIVINIALNLLAYALFKTTLAIAISSIIGISIWYVTTEVSMVKTFKVKWVNNLILILSGLIVFYGLSSMSNYVLAGTIYFIFIVVLIGINLKGVLVALKNE